MRGMKIGIDFGSSSLKICTESKGVVVDEPSVAAVERDSREPIAFGNAADEILGRTSDDIELVSVIQNGVIADFSLAERMLRYYLQRVCGNRIYKPNIIIAVSTDTTSLEKKIFLDAVTLAGAGRVCIVDGILASSFGCDVEADKLGGRMTLDIGHQLTEFAVVSMGCIAACGAVRRGSGEIDSALVRHLKRDRDIVIGPHTAREIKYKIASAVKREAETALMLSGKSNLDEMPISFDVTSKEIYPFVDEQLTSLIQSIHDEMRRIPPELLADAADHGINLCGGGALIFDIAQRIEKELGIRCRIAENPRLTKVNGLCAMMKNKELLEKNGYRFIFKDEIRDRLKRVDRI